VAVANAGGFLLVFSLKGCHHFVRGAHICARCLNPGPRSTVLSAIVGWPKDTIYRWIDRGLTAHRAGRHSKFKIDDVEEWVRHRGATDRDPADEGQR